MGEDGPASNFRLLDAHDYSLRRPMDIPEGHECSCNRLRNKVVRNQARIRLLEDDTVAWRSHFRPFVEYYTILILDRSEPSKQSVHRLFPSQGMQIYRMVRRCHLSWLLHYLCRWYGQLESEWWSIQVIQLLREDPIQWLHRIFHDVPRIVRHVHLQHFPVLQLHRVRS